MAASFFAQCIMCFRTAEAQQGERAKVLNSGIIILIVPPLLTLVGIVWFAWRRNKQQANIWRAEKVVESQHGESRQEVRGNSEAAEQA